MTSYREQSQGERVIEVPTPEPEKPKSKAKRAFDEVTAWQKYCETAADDTGRMGHGQDVIALWINRAADLSYAAKFMNLLDEHPELVQHVVEYVQQKRQKAQRESTDAERKQRENAARKKKFAQKRAAP
jgi:hypothetical protein